MYGVWIYVILFSADCHKQTDTSHTHIEHWLSHKLQQYLSGCHKQTGTSHTHIEHWLSNELQQYLTGCHKQTDTSHTHIEHWLSHELQQYLSGSLLALPPHLVVLSHDSFQNKNKCFLNSCVLYVIDRISQISKTMSALILHSNIHALHCIHSRKQIEVIYSAIWTGRHRWCWSCLMSEDMTKNSSTILGSISVLLTPSTSRMACLRSVEIWRLLHLPLHL